jgi:hypothetical protein
MGVIVLLNMIVGCSYETFFIARLGATPGKMALGYFGDRLRNSQTPCG